MEALQAQPGLSNEQLLLMEIRDKLCGGNSAELARRIQKDATYVNRLFYPEGKPGRKGIGLEIMEACDRAFFLPFSFWQLPAPALDDEAVALIKKKLDERNRFFHANPYAYADHILPAKPGMGGKFPPVDNAMALTYQEHAAFSHLAVIDGRVRAPAIYTVPGNHDVARDTTRVYDVKLPLQPIRAWEYEGDLPDGEFAMVPRLDIKLSAGVGSNAHQLEFDFDDGQLRAYSADWIRRNHLKPNKLRVMKAHGRSMEPTIFDGDDLLINLAETEVVDGKVYALWYEGGERVKRLFRMPGGGLRIRSDNDRDFPEIILTADYMGHVRIIGRVVDRSGPGGL